MNGSFGIFYVMMETNVANYIQNIIGVSKFSMKGGWMESMHWGIFFIIY